MKELNEIEKENIQLMTLCPVLFSIPKEFPFYVPDSYMNESETVLESLASFSHVSMNAFDIPENYFEHWETQFSSDLKLQYNNHCPFITDDYYFENTAENITHSVNICQFRSDHTFDVPENYFIENAEIICNNVQGKKIIKIVSPINWSYVMAAAACLAAVCFMFFYFIGNEIETKSKLTEKHLKLIKESPEDFELDESLIADLYEGNFSSEYETTLSSDFLIEHIVQDADPDLNYIIETN